MAIVHRAYSFDPKTFHRRLNDRLVLQKRLQLNVLLALAEEAVASASGTVQQALRDIRFDDEWLDSSDEEVSWTTHWYMVALAGELTPAPSLSNRSAVSWRVLELALPFLGWDEAEVRLLLRGKPLHSSECGRGSWIVFALAYS
jgi:hypothetical protein